MLRDIDSSNQIPTAMPSNRARIDTGLIQLTQYNIRPDRKAKKPCPNPGRCPNLNPSTSTIGTTMAGRKSQMRHIKARKPLANLSPNTTRKARNSEEWGR